MRLWNVCRYLSHCVGRGESAALECLSISVALCRTRGELGFSVFVGICRIVSVEGESAALVFLSISVALCRSRGRVRLWNVCRYLSHCVG